MPTERIQYVDELGTEWSIQWNCTAGLNAPTLFCLHGFTGSGMDFLPLLSAIGEDRTNSLCIDLPGHGKSSAPDDLNSYSIKTVLETLIKIPEIAGISGRLVVLGYSMGARIAMHYLTQNLDTEAILVSGSPGLKNDKERSQRLVSDDNWIRKLNDPGYSIDEFCKEWEAQPIIASQRELPDPLADEIAKRRRGNNPVGLANALRMWGTGSLPGLWDRIKEFQNQLLVVGEDDFKFCQIASEMVRINPSMRLEQIQDSGHSPHLEKPTETAIAIREYLFPES